MISPQKNPAPSWNVTPLLWHTCIWLLLPVFIFIAGWMHWYVGLPLAVLTAWGLGKPRQNGDLPQIDEPARLPFPLFTWPSAAVPAGFILLMLLSGWGEWFNQHPDHIVRNACLRELVASPWPVTFADGDILIYNTGFWLVPALAGKWAGLDAARIILPLWGAWGLYLSWLWLCVFGGRRCISAALLMILFGSLLNLPYWLGANLMRLHYFGIAEQIMCSANASIPAMLFFTCMASGRMPLAWLPVLFSAVAFYSPLAALGGLPLFLCQSIMQWKNEPGKTPLPRLITPITAAAALALCFILYYAHVNAPPSSAGIRIFYADMQDLLLIGTSFLIYAAFCWRDARRNPLFQTTLAAGLLLPFFHVSGDANDLLCKGSVPAMACLLAFLIRTWLRHSGLRPWIAALLILGMAPRFNLPYYCCAADLLRNKLQPQESAPRPEQSCWLGQEGRRLTCAPQARIQTAWGNTMHHPGHRWYYYYSGTPQPWLRLVYRF